MKIAILGTGSVARSVGSGLTDAGHDVVFGSRAPEQRALERPVLTLAEAARTADVVINALPGHASVATLSSLAAVLGGKTLVDLANAVSDRFELMYPNASLGAALQSALPDTHVVKTLNTIGASVMANPRALDGRSSVFLSGDDAAAKVTVGELLTDLGWAADDQVDLGGISTARGPEHFFFLSVGIGRVVGRPEYGIAVVRPA